jgi:hypothetical protein
MWYGALLSGDQIAAGCVAAIRSQFAIAIHSAGEPTGACLFVTSREIADVPEPTDAVPVCAEDAVYFSPASVAAVRELMPNTMPDRAHRRLVAARCCLSAGPQTGDLLPRRTHQ